MPKQRLKFYWELLQLPVANVNVLSHLILCLCSFEVIRTQTIDVVVHLNPLVCTEMSAFQIKVFLKKHSWSETHIMYHYLQSALYCISNKRFLSNKQ